MRQLLAIALFSVCIVSLSRAEERGTLQGRFVFDGKPAEVQRIKVDKDTEVCSDRLVDESLLVDVKTRGIANIVVQLYMGRDGKAPVHPQVDDLRKAPQELTVIGCCLEPRVTKALTAQDLIISNKDVIGHNIKVNVFRNTGWSRVLPGKGDQRERFHLPEQMPVEAGCSIHPWIRGYVVITDHPYVAISDTKGSFVISDLPPGKWTFRVWQERSGFIENVKREDAPVAWRKGRVTLEIRPGDNDLGDILVSPEEFPEK